MSGECEFCNEHTLECTCQDNARLQFAMSALNLALQSLSMLGYELKNKIEFNKFCTECKNESVACVCL